MPAQVELVSTHLRELGLWMYHICSTFYPLTLYGRILEGKKDSATMWRMRVLLDPPICESRPHTRVCIHYPILACTDVVL